MSNSNKVIGFSCYEIIAEQPVFPVQAVQEEMMTNLLSNCKTQDEVIDLMNRFKSLAHLLPAIAEQLNLPHKEFINKIILLS